MGGRGNARLHDLVTLLQMTAQPIWATNMLYFCKNFHLEVLLLVIHIFCFTVQHMNLAFYCTKNSRDCQNLWFINDLRNQLVKWLQLSW